MSELDERIAALAGGTWTYQPEDMAIAGVFVAIDRSGAFEIEPGWVRAEDEPVVEPGPEAPGHEGERQDQDDHDNAGTSGPGEESVEPVLGAEEEEDGAAPLPDRLVTELTAERTLALQDAVAGNPGVAFAAVLHNLVLATFYFGRTESCLSISLTRVTFGFQPSGMKHSPAAQAIDARHAKWNDRLPESDRDLWDALCQLDASEQGELFAHCAGYAVNALFEAAPRYDNGRVSAHGVERRLAHSHVLARAVGLDMVASGWKPTAENFFGKVTKAGILEAVTEAKGGEAAGRIDHLKKPDMAREAERLMEDAAWLPEPLRTPPLPAQAELLAAPDAVGTPAFLGEPGEQTEPDTEADAGDDDLAVAAE